MSVKVNVFNSKMALNEDTVDTVAEFLGIKRNTLRAKLNGTSDFKRNEINKLIARWNLTPDETHEIFYSD